MPGKPPKGTTYPKGKLNSLFGGFLFNKAAGPGEMVIEQGTELAGPTQPGATPVGQTDPKFIDKRSNWFERMLQPNTAAAAEQAYILAKANDLRQFGQSQALNEQQALLNAKNRLEETQAKLKADSELATLNSLLSGRRAEQAKLTDLDVNSASAKLAAQLAKEAAFRDASIKGASGFGIIPTDETVVASAASRLNPDLLRAAVARTGVEAGTLESPEGAAALKDNVLATLKSKGIDNLAKQFLTVAPGSAVARITDRGGQAMLDPAASNVSTRDEFEDRFNPATKKWEKVLKSSFKSGVLDVSSFIPRTAPFPGSSKPGVTTNEPSVTAAPQAKLPTSDDFTKMAEEVRAKAKLKAAQNIYDFIFAR